MARVTFTQQELTAIIEALAFREMSLQDDKGGWDDGNIVNPAAVRAWRANQRAFNKAHELIETKGGLIEW